MADSGAADGGAAPDHPLRVAVIGAGPAGIYTADALTRQRDVPVAVDLVDRLPTPFGLVRHGIAPDHVKMRAIRDTLHRVLDVPGVRFVGNVEVGRDIALDELRRHVDAVVYTYGAAVDRHLGIPGEELPGSLAATELVAWYCGHPDADREKVETALAGVRRVVVVGVGNVALDVARVLAKTADELLTTEIPDNVHQGLAASPVTDVHVFGRRGPAQAKFTPLELRELDHSPNVEVVVHPEGIDFDAASVELIRSNKQVEMVVRTLQEWAIRDVGSRPRRLHLHFLQAPVEVLGADGSVTGLRTERMELDGSGGVRGTGEHTDWPVQAVYRAVGYFGSPLDEVPFDDRHGVIPNYEGRVLGDGTRHLPGLYATGWIKRGPVGLIGHTKSDAMETVQHLINDQADWWTPQFPEEESVVALLEERGVEYTNLDGWHALDEHELALGEAEGRTRVKVVPREEMVAVSNRRTPVPS